MNPARRLTYRFLTLPHRKRVEVAVRLALMNDEDAGLSDRELLLRIFARARERRRLAELWKQVEIEYTNPSPDLNPFDGR